MHDTVAKPPRASRLRAKVGVTCPSFTSGGRRLEEKRERPTPKLRVRRDWRALVEQAVAPDRHEASGRLALRGAGVKFGEAGHEKSSMGNEAGKGSSPLRSPRGKRAPSIGE